MENNNNNNTISRVSRDVRMCTRVFYTVHRFSVLAR